MEETMKFRVEKEKLLDTREILQNVYDALKEKRV